MIGFWATKPSPYGKRKIFDAPQTGQPPKPRRITSAKLDGNQNIGSPCGKRKVSGAPRTGHPPKRRRVTAQPPKRRQHFFPGEEPKVDGQCRFCGFGLEGQTVEDQVVHAHNCASAIVLGIQRISHKQRFLGFQCYWGQCRMFFSSAVPLEDEAPLHLCRHISRWPYVCRWMDCNQNFKSRVELRQPCVTRLVRKQIGWQKCSICTVCCASIWRRPGKVQFGCF